MDYDYNDFAPQNIRLAGDADNKFPAGLHSYAPPKFDLHERLQVHLRYDSLGETGILLDILNQTADHWIEEYSREDNNILVLDPVSQSIDFGVSAEESCTISRNNNVWSEAASSESVEMLLNCVGQDEMNADKRDIARSDACDMLDRVCKQMNPESCHDESCHNAAEGSSIDPLIPPDSCPNNLPSLEIHALDDTRRVQNIRDNAFEHQCPSDQDLMPDNLHEGEAEKPSSSPERIPHAVESSHDTEAEPLSNNNESYEGVHVLGLEHEQAENKCSSEVVSRPMIVAEVNCVRFSLKEETSEKLVSRPTVSPTTQPDTMEANFPIGDASNRTSFEGSQVTGIAADANAINEEVPTRDSEVRNHPLDNEIVHKENDKLGEKHFVDKGILLINSSLVQDNSVSIYRSEGVKDCSLSIDFDCIGVQATITHVVAENMKSAILQREDDVELLECSKMPPIAHYSSKAPVTCNPLSSSIEDNVADVQCSVSGCKDASHSNVFSALGNLGVGFPQDLAEKDLMQRKIVELNAQASENVVTESLSSAGITETLDKFSPGPVGDVLLYVSDVALTGNSEGCVDRIVVEGNMMRSKDHLHQKEGTLDVCASGETDGREQVDGRCESLSNSSLSSSTAGQVQRSDDTELPAAVTDYSSGSVSYPSHDEQHSELQMTEVRTGAHENYMGAKEFPSSPNVDQSNPSEASEVSLRKVDSSVVVTGSLARACASKHQIGEASITTNKETLLFACSTTATFTNSPLNSKFSSEAGKHHKGEDSFISTEENPRECSPSMGRETVSFASSATVTLKNSPVNSKVPSDAAKVQPVLSAVDAPNRGEDIACGHDFLKNVDTSKNGADIATYVQPNCGSPTIISSTQACMGEHKYDEGKDSFAQGSDSCRVSCPPLNTSGHTNELKGTEKIVGVGDISQSDKSFTFEVGKAAGSFVDEKTGNGWMPFPSINPMETFQTKRKGSGDGTSTVSQLPNEEGKIEAKKDQSTCKSRSRSGSRTGRGTTSKGKTAKEPSSAKMPSSKVSNDKNVANTSASLGGPSLSSSGLEVKILAYGEGTATKPFSVRGVQMPNLSDLNSLISPTLALFQKPFTDMQQVQLRAQIFVYGSLMQGTAPDEACMVSAFGESGRDGGRSIWDNVWRVAVERSLNQKISTANPEISPLVLSGVRASEQTSRENTVQGHLSSPMWSMPTSSRDVVHASSAARASLIDTHLTVTPVQLHPSPHMMPFGGYHSPWPSRVPSPVPWTLSLQTSVVDAGSPYGTLSMPEIVQATPNRGQPVVASVIVPSSSQPVASTPVVSSAVVPSNIQIDVRTAATAGRHHSTVEKPRKRKNVAAEERQPFCVQLPIQSESPPVIAKHIFPQVSLAASTSPFSPAVSASKAACGDPTLLNHPVPPPAVNQIVSGSDAEQGVVSKEISRIEQAKLQAEDASALAASAVRHSQEIWNQLAVQRSSGVAIDIEQKLASAAVAAVAAASIAKAAAAVAKVASDAALQAKVMVDEALTMNTMVTVAPGTETHSVESSKNSGKVTPSSTLKQNGKQGISSSVIEFAKEAARKRVQAASAAAKRAQNLDAIVKAAELAAGAVSQATVIVGMGDPIPSSLSELLEAGLAKYCKHQEAFGYSMIAKTMESIVPLGMDSGEPSSLNGKASSKKDVQSSDVRNVSVCLELVKELSEQPIELVHGTGNGVPTNGTSEIHQQKACKSFDSANTNAAVPIPLSEFESRNGSIPSQSVDHENHDRTETSKGNSIEQGSLVEVISDEEGLRAVWFSATVLEVKDGNAYVCYSDLLSDEGTGQLKEWIPLGVPDGEPPRIRIAHPMTAMKFEGSTRKRRRAGMGNYKWSVGDHVDAWMSDGWWEGVITEKSKEDETKLTVHFLAEGDVRIVRAWNIRPSLVWKDGQWIEWSRERDGWVNEDDAPVDKRQKLDVNLQGDAATDKGNGNLSETDDLPKQQETMPLDLEPKDKIFSVGNSCRADNKLAVGRVKRTGLQKEGSKVVFGVPKPGKKRKFMDVSKHYNTEQVWKVSNVKNEAKFAKYLMPQRSSDLGGPSQSDPKGGRVSNPKSKDVKCGKPQTSQGRSRSEKVSSASALPSSSGNFVVELPRLPSSASHEDNSKKHKQMESRSLWEVPKVRGASGSHFGRAAPRGKLASASGQGTLASEPLETRRSNRRIQPTSRLLEGIQSSLTISKVSSSGLHEKGSKSSKR